MDWSISPPSHPKHGNANTSKKFQRNAQISSCDEFAHLASLIRGTVNVEKSALKAGIGM
jgi:hypothetical protein